MTNKQFQSLSDSYIPRYFLIIFFLFFTAQLHAQDEQTITQKLTLGTYFSSGNYGAEEETDIIFFPLTYELARFPWVVSVSVPYLGLKGPGDVFLETGNIGRGRGGEETFIDEKGMGDVFISTSYQFQPVLKGWVFVDFTFQAKIATADETRDLGTGETDLGYQFDFYSTIDRNTFFFICGLPQAW